MDNIKKCIYMLISPSEKVYVGQTRNLKRRFKKHKSTNGTCRILYRAIQKYGWNNFLKVIIEVFDDDVSDNYMNQREIYWIREHEAFGPKGYNCTEGGGGVSGHKHSAETRAKLSRANKGRKLSVEHIAKLKGRKFSAEHRANLSRAYKRRKLSAETRAKLSRAQKGRKHSAETRSKMSKAQKGRKRSAETRAKLRKYYEDMSEEAMAKHTDKSYQTAKKYMKPVIATEKKTGIKRNFESTYAAARTLANETGKKFSRAHISSCANKRPNYNSHHGWTFEFEIT